VTQKTDSNVANVSPAISITILPILEIRTPRHGLDSKTQTAESDRTEDDVETAASELNEQTCPNQMKTTLQASRVSRDNEGTARGWMGNATGRNKSCKEMKKMTANNRAPNAQRKNPQT
jgi:hypothetical protein